MAKTCPICGHQNPDEVDFCEDCGTDLKAGPAVAAPAEANAPAPPLPELGGTPPPEPSAQPDGGTPEAQSQVEIAVPESAAAPQEAGPAAVAAPTVPPPAVPAPPVQETQPLVTPRAPGQPGARLQARRYGAPSGEEISIFGDRVVLGRFDQETGPVDVDLSSFPESNYVSRRHCELYRTADGHWFVRDLGSSNGVFVRPKDSVSFGSRLSEAHELHDGDELALGNLRFIFRTDEGGG